MKKTLNIYGLHAATAVLQHNPAGVIKLHLQGSQTNGCAAAVSSSARLSAISSKAVALGIQVCGASNADLDKLADGQVHQGVVAEYVYPGPRNASQLLSDLQVIKTPWLVLALDEIQDPHNLGACLRSAKAMGVNAVLIPNDNSVGITPVVQKVSAGVAVTLPLYRVTNLARTLKQLQEAGAWLYGAAGEAQVELQSVDFKGSTVIVMGKESSGLRRLTREACDQLFKIPMNSEVESLNVSVATGVTLYEVQRQRLKLK